eukprot:gene5906-4221_t
MYISGIHPSNTGEEMEDITKCFFLPLSLCTYSVGQRRKAFRHRILASPAREWISALFSIGDIMAPPAAGQAAQLTAAESRRQRAIAQMSDLRMQPVKQLPMTVFFMWMTGNEISIFTIMFLSMAFISPLTAIINTGKAFEPFQEAGKKDKEIASFTSQSKLIYMACCVAALSVALLKLHWMSLLPVSMMDWMSTEPMLPYERSVGGLGGGECELLLWQLCIQQSNHNRFNTFHTGCESICLAVFWYHFSLLLFLIPYFYSKYNSELLAYQLMCGYVSIFSFYDHLFPHPNPKHVKLK